MRRRSRPSSNGSPRSLARRATSMCLPPTCSTAAGRAPRPTRVAPTHRNFEAKRKDGLCRAPPAPAVRLASAPPCSTLPIGSRLATGLGRRRAPQSARRAPSRRACQGELAQLSQAHQAQGRRPSPSERQATPQIAHPRQAAALRDRFFASHVSGRGQRQARAGCSAALKDVQDALGGLNDLATRHGLMREDASSSAIPDPAKEQTLRDRLLKAAEQAFARFAAAKPFWKA